MDNEGQSPAYIVAATAVSILADTCSDWSYHSNKKHHSAHNNNNSDVETNTDGCVALLGLASAV